MSVLARWAIEPALKTGAARGVRITRRGVFRTWTAATLKGRAEPAWQHEFITLLGRHPLPVRALRA